jgi:type VI secretion system protein ImpB
MAESMQHKLSRVRPPRVQITYDVEIGDAIERKELPFVIGVMADLSAKPAEPLQRLADRKFVGVDRDNFNECLAAASPRVAFRTPNRLQPDAEDMISVELTFERFDDFAPENIVRQVPPLAKLFEARGRLRDLLTKLDGNERLGALLADVVDHTERHDALKAQLADSSAAPDTATPDAAATKAKK